MLTVAFLNFSKSSTTAYEKTHTQQFRTTGFKPLHFCTLQIIVNEYQFGWWIERKINPAAKIAQVSE
jgi:hypothetical protein